MYASTPHDPTALRSALCVPESGLRIFFVSFRFSSLLLLSYMKELSQSSVPERARSRLAGCCRCPVQKLLSVRLRLHYLR